MLWSVSVEIHDESGESIPMNSMLVVHWCYVVLGQKPLR